MKFATCLNCMDGRVQLPVIQWIKKNYGVDFVDMITEAGIDGILADENYEDMHRLLRKIDISIEKHNSNTLFIVGHYDCGGNPVDDETHKKHICVAVNKLKNLKPTVPVIGLWVSGKWVVEKITEK